MKRVVGLNKLADSVSATTETVSDTNSVSVARDTEALEVDYTEVEAVVVPVITDKHGRISDSLDAITKELKVSVVPISITSLLPEAKTLQRYDILVVGGERYVSAKEPRQNVVNEYKKQIYNTLADGVPAEISLWTEIPTKNGMVRTLALSKAEWSLLCSYFRRYNPTVEREKDSGDVVLRVGF